jgi:hypothetical protein
VGNTNYFSPIPSITLAVNAPVSQYYGPSAYLAETKETP